jgi:hypothetical protein
MKAITRRPIRTIECVCGHTLSLPRIAGLPMTYECLCGRTYTADGGLLAPRLKLVPVSCTSCGLTLRVTEAGVMDYQDWLCWQCEPRPEAKPARSNPAWPIP